MRIKINILNTGNAGSLAGALVSRPHMAWEGADGKTSRWAGSGIAGKGGAESKQTSVSGRFVHTCLEREKTAKPSVT